MSRESRQRLREARAEVRLPQGRPRRRWFVPLVALLVAGLSVVAWQRFGSKPKTHAESPEQAGGFKPPATFAELCALKTNELANCDIALMNLLCAEGLRGAENLNVKECLERLDGIAQKVKSEIDRHLYKFRDHPEEFNHSEGYYRMMMMATVLQQDLGIRYNPARARSPWNKEIQPSEVFFANSQDVFIHGLARERGAGTCSSMPVFYVAIGRRLGYPLKLVRAQGHLFARWDEGDKSFNIEGTSLGFVSDPDSFYRTWPRAFTAEEAEAESYLKPLTPVQELATFLSIRGACCRAATNWLWALGSYQHAFKLEPQSVGHQLLFAVTERDAYIAGELPKRAALQFAIRSLELPPGPLQAEFLARKASLNARNLAGADEGEIEWELDLLRTEVNSFRGFRYPGNP